MVELSNLAKLSHIQTHLIIRSVRTVRKMKINEKIVISLLKKCSQLPRFAFMLYTFSDK